VASVIPAPTQQPDLDGLIDTLQARIDVGEPLRVVIEGGPASGRSTFMERIATSGWIDVLDPSQPDTVADALLQIDVLCGHPTPVAGPITERLTAAQRALNQRGKPLFVRLHAGWGGTAEAGSDEPGFREHAARLLAVLMSQRVDVPVIVVGKIARTTDAEVFKLRVPGVDWTRFDDAKVWDHVSSFSVAAFQLQKRCSDLPHVSPIVARLAVGRIALGEDKDQVIADVRARPTWMAPHVHALLRSTTEHPELADALARVANLRRPIPKAQLLQAVPIVSEWAPLLTSVLGYTANGGVRFSEPVLAALRAHGDLILRSDPKAHMAVAKAYEHEDGLADPSQIQHLPRARCWTEKVHHFAHGGPEGLARWREQTITQNELRWVAARALSRDGGFREAADLYEQCVREDEGDDYAWHYLGYNLDRLGHDTTRVKLALENAVELSPANPWWNARHITWLIDQVRYAEALEAWERALTEIDPSRSSDDPWLVRHFHRHVVAAWLDAGEVSRARAAYEAIPERLRGEDSAVELERRLVDYEEAQALQGSVRPYGLIGAARWEPRALPAQLDNGSALTRWYACHVQGVGDDGVRLRAATSSPTDRRVLAYTAPWATWRAWGGSDQHNELHDRFAELGEYGDTETVLVRVLPRVERPVVERRSPWVEAWRTR
jgi:tetratricopeptide (TPR) repeat protein